jgi:hypothetical protein
VNCKGLKDTNINTLKPNIMKKNLLTVVLLFVSFSLYAQWQVTNGPSGAGHISSLAVKDTVVFAGTETGGVFISTNQGVTWTASNSGITNMNEVRALVSDSMYVFAGMYNSLGGPAVFSSVNDGSSWTPAGLSFVFFFSFARKPGYLVAGTWDGVSVSTNNGTTFNSFTAGLPSNASVAALAYSGTKLFGGVSGSSVGGTGVFYSNNNGTSWNAFNTGLTNTIVNQLAVLGSYVFAGTSAGVFRSPVATAGWSPVNTGLGNVNIKSFYTIGTTLYAGTANGIYSTTDNGANWNDVSAGLPPNTNVYSLTSDSDFMYAGTDTVVYRRPLSEVVSATQELSAVEPVISIYPNPASKEFFLTMGTDHSKNKYDVSMFNLLGEKMLEHACTGENETIIDVSRLSSGIYFVKVTASGTQVVKKVIVE